MIDNFIQYIRCIKGYSLNTCRAYEFDLRQFASYMTKKKDDARWGSIDRQDIDEYIIYLREQGAAASTTNRVIASISGIYKYFQREGMLTDNPCKFETRAKLPEAIPNTIPMADLFRAYDNAMGVTKTMIGLLSTTGIRIQELLDMKWEDINFEDNTIRIQGKGCKQRVVTTTAKVLEPLREVSKYTNPTGRMFFLCQRRARFLIYEAVRPYTRARQVSPHAIRHSYATELAKQGANVATIGKVLGHKRIDTTQKYIDMAQVETASKSLANVIKKASCQKK